ncbi:RiPP maturation radical SAM C-methyltransferase [Paractinoplanes globisporus]|uniref:RiPP maturation radical SAM C-methyltransferase n=1 Tax=Paractinoplanes globisporus TaxID=113565 RepID=A0ABW6WM45_9ACTN|nr:RiPP maturation radical SAM C-methyltransferase [Actinoplanes globisporus]
MTPAGTPPARPKAAVVVSMPFMDIDRPSIQLGILASVARQHGFEVRTLHANLDFAARIGADCYRLLSEHRGRMLGEWLFSVDAFGAAAPDPDGRLLTEFAGDLGYLGPSPEHIRRTMLAIRDQDVPAYLSALIDAFPWHEIGVVGFTSTYQQTMASFALARRLKQRYPAIVTVFGGANFDGEMGPELVRTVECIDYAVIGEGDVAFPLLLSALAGGTGAGTVPGVASRNGDGVVITQPAPPLPGLDGPAPDYDEYFERAEQLGVLPRTGHREAWIPFESARGCWWGAKHHCTFCGLNGTTMRFRAKPAARVIDELAGHARRYRGFRFQAVDNILDMSYLTTVLPELVASGADYEIFYEVKANLTRAQLRLMAQAGVSHIQPGVESLSSHVLQLMRKGVRAAQNVNLLKWARYYGIDAGWNILWGFPDETEADYAEQVAAIPHLRHLPPPATVTRVWMERFSPLYTGADTLPLRRTGPEASYRYVYPEDVDLDRVAYFFEYELDEPLPDTVYRSLDAAVGEWRAAWQSSPPPALTSWWAPGFLQIHDSRGPGPTGTYTFTGPLAEIYRACGDRPRTAAGVRDELRLDLAVEEIDEIFTEFGRRGLMFLDGTLAVALALPAVPAR